MKFSKENLYRIFDVKKQQIAKEGHRFFNCPEPGFRESQTEEMICERLQKMGIPFERDLALTGVHAQIGQGDYHIAVVADMDALPRKDGNGFIHSCGHSIQTANALAMLEVLSGFSDDPGFDGRISVFFTPAEELTDPEFRKKLIAEEKIRAFSGKQHMIVEGLFDDVDCVLSCHASGDPAKTFNINSVLTGFLTKKVTFLGKAAHSGAMPHLGRNALNGAMLAGQGISFLKDQFSPDEGVCIQPVISKVSGGINIIPDEAVMETYIRALNVNSLLKASEKFDRCVQSCANALELETRIETAPGYLPLKQSRDLNQITRSVMLELVDEQHILYDPISGASGDIGDLGTLIPSIQFGFSGIRGNFHTDNFEVEDEEFCYITAAKVMTGIVYELLKKPEKRVYPQAFRENKNRYINKWLKNGSF